MLAGGRAFILAVTALANDSVNAPDRVVSPWSVNRSVVDLPWGG